MATNEIPLVGCSPTPLASYLKALGVLRLTASPTSRASGIAADPAVRGYWRNECFHLHTSLDHEALMRFFLEDYAPTPIIAPWNGGSGFYPGDNKTGIELLAGSEVALRFSAMATAIRAARSEIQEQELSGKRPEGPAKARLVSGLRGRLADVALDWLDAALALSGNRLSFPQLLGTGGNDGRLEFTNNFMQRLVSTFDIATGKPKEDAARLLRTALFSYGTWDFQNVAIGQFAPGATGGDNASTGYEGKASVNPWDFVLALEGAVMFAGAATRRHQGAPESGASFPFTVRSTGAGWGGVSDADENSARAEFWAPLWNQPAGYRELEGLLREGRAVLTGKTARDGLDFARAVASLGISRGISAFARYGFMERSGKAYFAAPLGTRSVASRTYEAVELIGDLDAGGWLRQIRRRVRETEAPARARVAVRQLEDALFAMSEAHVSARSVQGALSALGALVGWLADNRDVRERISPPRLSDKWVYMADDETPEYRVAVALASLGRHGRNLPRDAFAQETDALAGEAPPFRKPGPLAVHFAPLDAEQGQRYRVVWGKSGLESNLIAVLQRRLIDDAIDDPLAAEVSAQLADVAAFLGPDFDDTRCARLLAGLVWAQPARLSFLQQSHTIVPFAYAALKPIFTSALSRNVLSRKELIPPDTHIPIPPGLIARLRRGDIGEAVRLALARARASGIACPFGSLGMMQSVKMTRNAKAGCRLAAALLIPLEDRGLQILMERAYPAEKENEDVN